MIQEKFSYAAQPHAAPMKNKTKYRDENDVDESNITRNMMNDPRIIRGNTYATAIEKPKASSSMKIKTVRTDPRKKFTTRRASTPPPVEGRAHIDMQTDDFLEELTDRPIEIDAETQTQPFLDRPPSPLFVRAKTGHDISTQILSGDLFDFDLEVEPILEVLVGKTIHVSMLELMQEEELEAIRLQQEEFEAIRNVELAEVQRLEAEARRRNQEKERRVAQEKERVEQRRALDEKIAARSFSRQYLGNLHLQVFDMLEQEGVFYDPLQHEIQEGFLGGVISSAKVSVESYSVARQMAEELLEAARSRAREFESTAIALRQEMYERLARERAEAEEAARLKAEEEARAAAAAAAAGEGGEQE